MPEAIDFSDKEHQFIEMPSGKRFYMADPKFNLPDLVYAIARQPRWNGTNTRPIYTAEHCVRVSYLIIEEGGDPFEGLCHDLHEAILGDVPGPWKALLPDFCNLEAYVWRKMVEQMTEDLWVLEHGLDPNGVSIECKRADWRALMIEGHDSMPSHGKDWTCLEGTERTEADPPPYYWSSEEAEERFHQRWDELTVTR